MEILILRGIHDKDMAEDIAVLTQGADIIFMETATTRLIKAQYTELWHRITFKPNEFAPEVLQQIAADPNGYIQIAWKLKGSNKLIIPVDKTFENDTELAEYQLHYFSALSTEQIAKYIENNDVEFLYEAFAKNIREAAGQMRLRDQLVVSQIKETLAQAKQTNSPPSNIALVQGYMHYPEPYLQDQIPELALKNATYNDTLAKSMAATPYNRALFQAMHNPSSELDRLLIGQALYVILRKAVDHVKVPDFSSMAEFSAASNTSVHDELEIATIANSLDLGEIEAAILSLSKK